MTNEVSDRDFMFDDGWQVCKCCDHAIDHTEDAELECFNERQLCTYCATIEDEAEKREYYRTPPKERV